MKNSVLKSILAIFLCLSIIFTQNSLTWIYAQDKENLAEQESIKNDSNMSEENQEQEEQEAQQDQEKEEKEEQQDQEKEEQQEPAKDEQEDANHKHDDVKEDTKDEFSCIEPRYSEQNPGEGDRYTSDEEWVPKNMEKKQIQNSKFNDDKSIVYLIMADGFQDNPEDKAKFEKEAKSTMNYLNSITPYNEFEDITTAYTLYTPSKDSGATLDMSYEDYKKEYLETGKKVDFKDTFFRCSFNVLSDSNYNYERLLEPTMAGMQRAMDVAEEYNVPYDQLIIISNSDRYGGSGLSSVWPDSTADKGDGSGTVTVKATNIAVSSTNSASPEVVAHEVGHALGSLADEYWPGEVFAEELANMTQNKDPNTIKWKEFLKYENNTGTGIYPYEGYGDPAAEGWYRPTKQKCKMEVLSTSTVDYEFCEVCREGFRESMAKFSNATVMYWQDYGKNSKPVNAQKNTFDNTGYKTEYTYTGKEISDIESSFLIRQGNETINSDSIKFKYYDENKQELEGTPKNPGKYYVKATYKSDNEKYNDCEYTKGFEIIESKTPVWNEIEDLDVTYTGKSIKLDNPTYTIGSTSDNSADEVSYRYVSKDGKYESELPPTDAGEYTVYIEASVKDYPDYTYNEDVNIIIRKAPLTITANNQTVKQNDELPQATYTIEGFVNDESDDVFTTNTLKAIYENDDTSEVGTYNIKMFGEITSNSYDYKLVDGTLNVVENNIPGPEEDKEDDDKEPGDGDNQQPGPDDDDNQQPGEDNGNNDSPQTGDKSRVLIYSLLGLISGAILLIATKNKKRL